MAENHELHVRDFLAAHPEQLQGVKRAVVDGREELVLDMSAMVAFVEWSIRERRCDPVKAKKFLEYMKARLPGAAGA